MLLTRREIRLLLGANRPAEGYNFALDVPEGEEVKLLLYKKGGKDCPNIFFHFQRTRKWEESVRWK